MNANEIKNEVSNGNTVRVRKAVRNALRQMVTRAMRAGFSADCELEKLDFLTFTADAVCAGASGFINCRNHQFTVAIPFGDIR